MKDHSDTQRAFYQSSKAWYSKYNQRDDDEITFGMYSKSGGIIVDPCLLDLELV